MSRYIDADALKESMRGEFFDSVEEWTAIRKIDEAPSIDIEPKRGEWIAHKGMVIPENRGKHYCSNCYHTIHLALNGGVYNFCPNCGADMREREGE